MLYKTDSAIIRHICINLMPNILKKYKFNEYDKAILKDARKILLKLTKQIDNKNDN